MKLREKRNPDGLGGPQYLTLGPFKWKVHKLCICYRVGMGRAERRKLVRGENRKAYEPAGDFVHMSITRTTGEHF